MDHADGDTHTLVRLYSYISATYIRSHSSGAMEQYSIDNTRSHPLSLFPPTKKDAPPFQRQFLRMFTSIHKKKLMPHRHQPSKNNRSLPKLHDN